MKTKKIILIILIMILSCTLSGCWDSIEINKRAFVLGIGIDRDLASNDKIITYEIALPSQMAKGGSEETKDSKGNATWDITKMASTMIEADNTMNENIDRTMDLGHMQLIIIGSQLAKTGIFDFIDFFLRSPDVRRLTKVVYFDGKPSDALKVEPKTTKSPAMFISSTLDNNVHYTHTIFSAMELNKLSQDIIGGYDFVLPKVSLIDDQIRVDGAAAFTNDGKFACNVDEGEVEVASWLREEVHTGNIEVLDPQSPSKQLIFGISDGTSKIKPIFDDTKVNFKMDLNVEGDIEEIQNTNFLGTMDVKYLEAVQKAAEDMIKTEIIYTFNKYEKEKKVDIFELERKIKNYNIKFYQQHKDKIKDLLTESNLEIKVTVKIRRVGLAR